MNQYKFVNKKEDLPQTFSDKERKFYQICQYPYKDNKYYVKAFTINVYCNVSNIENRVYSREQLDRLLKTRNPNTYKIYSTTQLTNIPEPNVGFFCETQSELLNNKFF
jgi:hypothetical protein